MNTEITQAQAKPATLKAILNSENMKLQIAACLPKHMTAERMARVVTTAMLRTPKLADCDQASFFKAILDLSAWGLEPDGRRAHLIPFRNNKLGIMECQLILDYKGLVELARRSGEVATIHADVICKNDDFSYAFGSDQHLRHRPNLEDRGPILGSYAHVRLKDGTEQFEVLSKSEIDGIRGRSRSKDNGPWVTDYNEMAKKSSFRRLSKWLPISAEMADAFERDNEDFERRGAGERDVTPKAAPVPIALRDVPDAPVQPVKAQPEPVVEAEPEQQPTTTAALAEMPEAWGEEEQALAAQAAQETQTELLPPEKPKTVAAPEKWQEITIHFGEKTQGKKLGELSPKILLWFQGTWTQAMNQAIAEGKDITPEDAVLLAAVKKSIQPTAFAKA